MHIGPFGPLTSLYTQPYVARSLVSTRLVVTDTLLAYFRSKSAHRGKKRVPHPLIELRTFLGPKLLPVKCDATSYIKNASITPRLSESFAQGVFALFGLILVLHLQREGSPGVAVSKPIENVSQMRNLHELIE